MATDQMRPLARNLPILLLVVAILFVDNALFVGVAGHPGHVLDDPPLHATATLAFVLCEACLLGIWAAVGRTRTVFRLLAVAAIALGLIRFTEFLDPRHPNPWFYRTSVFWHISLVVGSFAAALGIGRLRGSLQLRRISEKATGGATGPRPFRFTISDMLRAVASCCAVLAIVKFSYPRTVLLPRNILAVQIAYAEIFVIPGLIAIWATLGTNLRIWKLGVLAAAAWGITCSFSAIDPERWVNTGESLGIWLYLALVTGSLLVFRICGFRIIDPRQKMPTAQAVETLAGKSA